MATRASVRGSGQVRAQEGESGRVLQMHIVANSQITTVALAGLAQVRSKLKTAQVTLVPVPAGWLPGRLPFFGQVQCFAGRRSTSPGCLMLSSTPLPPVKQKVL